MSAAQWRRAMNGGLRNAGSAQPAPVPVRAAALPHRLSGILKGVKLLENRLKDFGSGEDGWQQTMQARILKSPL